MHSAEVRIFFNNNISQLKLPQANLHIYPIC